MKYNRWLFYFKNVKKVAYCSVTALAVLMTLLPLQALAVSNHKIIGSLVDNNGMSPLSQYTIFIPDFSTLSLDNQNIYRSKHKSVGTTLGKDSDLRQSESATSNCSAPTLPYISYTCTNSRGEFSLQFFSDLTQTYQLAIVGQSFRMKIDVTHTDTDLGFVRINNTAQQASSSIAIVATASTGTGHLNTANGSGATYLLDSEILSAYGINSENKNIEYHSSLLLDLQGNSVLDVERYATVLVKGSWQLIGSEFDQNTIQRMLDYVSNGGKLLIKGNKVNLSQHSKNTPYI